MEGRERGAGSREQGISDFRFQISRFQITDLRFAV
jgi:hypothetical protein